MSDSPEVVDPGIEARLRECLRRFQTVDFDASQWRDSGRLARYMSTPQALKWSGGTFGALGDAVALEFVGSDTNARRVTAYHFHVTFRNGRVRCEFALAPDGTIDHFALNPIPGETDPFQQLHPTR